MWVQISFVAPIFCQLDDAPTVGSVVSERVRYRTFNVDKYIYSMVVRGSLVTAVVEDIRSTVGGGVSSLGAGRDDGDDDVGPQRRQKGNGGSVKSCKTAMRRSVSPAKRKKEHDGGSQGYYDDGDGLAVLLKACEILDKDLSSVKVREVGGSSVKKQEEEDGGCPSPAKSPRKSSRSCSPSKPRLEKPQGPCTNSHCLNPNESPQWRRGPPEAPVLCNACGTRWIRNKSLVPLVVCCGSWMMVFLCVDCMM